ncbi:MAG: AIR synthase family protein [Brevefilum sp.]
MPKFPLHALQHSVYSQFQSDDKDVVVGSAFGEDVALTRVGDDLLASHLDPIEGAVQDIGWLAVHVACNDIATCGARPRWIQLLVMVPRGDEIALLETIMGDVSRAAKEVGAVIIGGHTEYSDNLSRPLVAVTAFGLLEGKEPVLTSGAQPGDHILVTKGIPLEGTAILAHDFAEAARRLGLTDADLSEAKGLMKQVSVVAEALILADKGASAMHDVTDGGLLETLREISYLSDVEIWVDYDKIPMPTVGERFAEAFGFDPMRMISSGTLVAAVPANKLRYASRALNEAGIHFADIGLVSDGEGVRIQRDREVLEFLGVQPEEGELARMWEEYQPD